MKATRSWQHMDSYLRTWSVLLSYHERHPEDKARQGRGKEGDILNRFLENLKDKLPLASDEVDIEWPLALMMIKKKGVS
jgi:trans-aconitate 3-methyltransferase